MDELCAITGWHRDHARKAFRQVLIVKEVKPRPARLVLHDEAVIQALRFRWAVQGTPCGRLLAAALIDLVLRLRGFDELHISNATAAKLLTIAPATIDRRFKVELTITTSKQGPKTQPARRASCHDSTGGSTFSESQRPEEPQSAFL